MSTVRRWVLHVADRDVAWLTTSTSTPAARRWHAPSVRSVVPGLPGARGRAPLPPTREGALGAWPWPRGDVSPS
jgi:hypothetical protein